MDLKHRRGQEGGGVIRQKKGKSVDFSLVFSFISTLRPPQLLFLLLLLGQVQCWIGSQNLANQINQEFLFLSDQCAH